MNAAFNQNVEAICVIENVSLNLEMPCPVVQVLVKHDTPLEL